jgi:uncharacterized membrane protein SirB2
VIEFYPEIRAVHIGAVLVSGALFLLRGVGALLGARWPQAVMVRWLSVGIDTVLLTAALMLLNIVPAALFANHWLGVKLALLVVYVVLGSFALKRARSTRGRAICFVVAVLVFVAMLGIARRHQPLGWLALASLPLQEGRSKDQCGATVARTCFKNCASTAPLVLSLRATMRPSVSSSTSTPVWLTSPPASGR